ncbi:hypothetical protein [Sphaerisporangium sp. TRM90804]|uniref:hypothetical protein n=1 Tax=Sphaerisporangium sp. TRM90804 TaxID=3031113 RepID=UPI0024471869|nr:hypothetical protein [Sphaerisporangium sp. TRM90804]MDH2429540.1 hypothetical protein [Sphaerisporangium sp. TRM90804]
MRRRRVIAWTAGGVAVLLVLAAGVVWSAARFDGRRVAMAGLPFDLVIQPGVTGPEVRAVEDGLRLADRHLRSALGQGVRERVEVRLARGQGCRWRTSADGPSTAWAEPRLMCVNTLSPGWREAMTAGTGQAQDVIAHEHVHNLQGQVGCFRAADDHEWLWLFEGMAVHLAYRAMVDGGRWREEDEIGRIRSWGADDPSLGPLSGFERTGAGLGDPAYALFHLAVRSLARGPNGTPALLDFCRATAQGRPWRTAFADAFGITLDTFYTKFEQLRRGTI